MQLAKVVGNLVSTHKNELVKGMKFMFVQPIDESLEPFGDEMIAIDGVGAGVGDTVILIGEGKSARTVTNATSDYAPIDLCIAGIVDSIKTKNDYKIFK